MKEISKLEGKIIKNRLNLLLKNFNTLNRHQLKQKLTNLGKFIHPVNSASMGDAKS